MTNPLDELKAAGQGDVDTHLIPDSDGGDELDSRFKHDQELIAQLDKDKTKEVGEHEKYTLTLHYSHELVFSGHASQLLRRRHNLKTAAKKLNDFAAILAEDMLKRKP